MEQGRWENEEVRGEGKKEEKEHRRWMRKLKRATESPTYQGLGIDGKNKRKPCQRNTYLSDPFQSLTSRTLQKTQLVYV